MKGYETNSTAFPYFHLIQATSYISTADQIFMQSCNLQGAGFNFWRTKSQTKEGTLFSCMLRDQLHQHIHGHTLQF